MRHFMNVKMEMERLNREYTKLPRRVKGWSLSSRFVPGEGPLNADVVIIGQAPGRNEDIQKRPFIGTSGKFLDRLIGLAGLERRNVYIFSIVQFFPPGNRIPTRQEIMECKRFAFRQIDIIKPKVVVLLGSVAVRTVLEMDNIAKMHGKIVKRDGITYLLSMHPAAAVRIRSRMPLMERDFRMFGSVIKSARG